MEEKKTIRKLTVRYCGVCNMPPEYCELSKKIKKCRVWVKENLPEEFEKLPAEPTNEDEQKKEEDEEKKQEEKEAKQEEKKDDEEDKEKKPKKHKKKKNTGQAEGDQITVTVQKRMGKKRITLIMGLLSYGLTLKDVAKKCSKRFACSTSVLENQFIEIQGDKAEEVPEFLCKEYKDKITEDMFTVNNFEEAPKKPPHPKSKKAKQLAKEAEEEEEMSGVQNKK